MHSRDWSLDQFGDSTGPAERVDDFVGIGFHNRNLATIATKVQAKSCDIGNCADGAYDFVDVMDADQIRALVRNGKDKRKALAQIAGMDETAFSKFMASKRQLKAEELDALRRFYGYKEAPEDDGPRKLPVVGLISAGRWREGFETVIDWVYSPDPSLSANAFVVIVDGDSMDKVADPGDRIIIEPRDRRLISGKLYVIRNGNGETTFKRYMDNPARLEPCSNNDRHEVIYPGEDGFEVIGRAVMKATDL